MEFDSCRGLSSCPIHPPALPRFPLCQRGIEGDFPDDTYNEITIAFCYNDGEGRDV